MARIQRQYSRIGGIVLASILTVTPLALVCAAPLNAAATYSAGIDRHEPAQLLDGNAIEAMVAPVALYPDELLGIVLRAASFPLQVVQASRYLEAHASDPYLEPAQDWDDAVVALLNYPEVIQLLNSDLGWAQDLGHVVTFQQPEVIQAVQRFRQRAYVAGNLQSDAQKIVNHEQGIIEILSADPTSVYVPYYEPTKVIYTQSTPSYHYYPQRYPVYNYTYPEDHAFYANSFWGVTTGYSIGWLSHRLFSHRLFSHRDNFRRHNYVGRRYYHPGRRHGNISTHRDRPMRHDNRHGFRSERHRADGFLGGRAHQRGDRRKHASNRHDRGQFQNRRADNRRHYTPAIATARDSAGPPRSRSAAQRNAPPASNAEQRNRPQSHANRIRGGDANRRHRQAQRATSPAQRRSTVNNSRSNFTPALMNVPAVRSRFEQARKQGNTLRQNAMQRTQPRKARPTQRRAPTAQRNSRNNAGRIAARGPQTRQVRPNRSNARRAERPNRRAGAGTSRNRNRANRRRP